jgi:hypothetical protein
MGINFVSDYRDIKSNIVKRDQEGYNKSALQEEILIIKDYAPDNRALNYIKQTLQN